MNQRWYEPDNVVWSEKQGWIPKNDVVEVYIDISKIGSDWRMNDDDYIIYKNENDKEEYYDKDILGDQFVPVKISLTNNSITYYKKDDYNKRFFKWNDDYYDIKFKTKLNKKTKVKAKNETK